MEQKAMDMTSTDKTLSDFRDYDRAPEDELNRILWYVAKGPNVPYPTPIHRAVIPEVFNPGSSPEQ